MIPKAHLIVNVETTPAAVSDEVMVPVIHAALAEVGRLPSEHLVDAGYIDAPVLLESRRTYGVTLIGPVADDPSWQAAPERASPKPTSRSIGTAGLSPAPPVRRASPGYPTPTQRLA